MAKLYLEYGNMGSSKSAALLTNAFKYLQQGKNIFLMKSELDTREHGYIYSRALKEKRDAFLISRDCDVFEVVAEQHYKKKLDCVFVDEAQFLSKAQVLSLSRVVDELNVPVMCYGLLSTYTAELFEGMEALMVYADSRKELKTVCEYCSAKATMVLLLKDGKPVREGSKIRIGDIKKAGDTTEGVEVYVPVCRKHWKLGGCENSKVERFLINNTWGVEGWRETKRILIFLDTVTLREDINERGESQYFFDYIGGSEEVDFLKFSTVLASKLQYGCVTLNVYTRDSVVGRLVVEKPDAVLTPKIIEGYDILTVYPTNKDEVFIPYNLTIVQKINESTTYNWRNIYCSIEGLKGEV